MKNDDSDHSLQPRGKTYEDIPLLASRLMVAERTVQNWMAEGRIPYVRLGRLVRFDPVVVDEALAANFTVRGNRRAIPAVVQQGREEKV